ncbi:MAG: FAD-binding oxidoreductase [Candidatus Puniceispirillum sp.]
MGQTIIIIGGGIVGVSAGLQLQRDGYQVRLIDRKQPGRETSYGNAGVLSDSSVMVLNNPGLLKNLPKLLLGRSNALRYDLGFVLRRIGWVARFLAHCRPGHMHHAARALRALLTVSQAQHKRWIAEAGVDHLLKTDGGWLKLFRTEKGFANYQAEMDLMRSVGVRFTVYEAEEIRQMEPALMPRYHKAVMMDDTAAISSPADLTDAYVAMFVAAGGVIETASVTGVAPDSDGRWLVTCDGGASFDADKLVLAAGAWSAEIAAWLGYDIPMAWERGYHQHLAPGDGPRLRQPIYDVEGGFVIAPMRQGMRVTSGVEITDRDAPPEFRQINKAVALAKDVVSLGTPVEDEPWMGRRPTLVDSLPMIGPAPRHANLWFNFGHQHIGLSMGPGSALLLAAQIAGTPPPIDAAPFRVDRFAV